MHISTSFLVFAAAMSVACAVDAAEIPQAAWSKAFDSNTAAGDNGTAVTVDADGNVLFLNTLGSVVGALECSFGGEKIFDGAPYGGTGQNNNFALTKTDSSGNVLWTIYSDAGDCDSQQGSVVACPDGSVVFSAKMRHTDGMFDKAFTFVDASDNHVVTGVANVEARWYSLILGKADADGNILWIRNIDVAHGADPAGKAQFTANAAYAKGLALDSDGNIYMGGNYRMPLTFVKSDNSTVVVPARCVEGWNGDSQSTRGGLFVAKFTPDGYFDNILTTSGSQLNAEQVLAMTAVDNTVYIQGYVTASATESATLLGGKQLTAGDEGVASPFVAAIDGPSFDVEWISATKGSAVGGRSAFQNATLTAAGNSLWLAAQFNGCYESALDNRVSVQSQTGNMREGLLIKLDRTNGNWMAATNSRTGFSGVEATAITGYSGVVQPDSHHVYVYGYGMNAAVGTYMRCYDAESLAPQTVRTWQLLKGDSNSSPTALAMAYHAPEGRIYTTVRNNRAVIPMGGEATTAPQAWAVWATAFDMPSQFLTGVENVSVSNLPRAAAVAGGIEFSSPVDCRIDVFDLSGRRCASVSVSAGEKVRVDLRPGVYFAAGIKLLCADS